MLPPAGILPPHRLQEWKERMARRTAFGWKCYVHLVFLYGITEVLGETFQHSWDSWSWFPDGIRYAGINLPWRSMKIIVRFSTKVLLIFKVLPIFPFPLMRSRIKTGYFAQVQLLTANLSVVSGMIARWRKSLVQSWQGWDPVSAQPCLISLGHFRDLSQFWSHLRQSLKSRLSRSMEVLCTCHLRSLGLPFCSRGRDAYHFTVFFSLNWTEFFQWSLTDVETNF